MRLWGRLRQALDRTLVAVGWPERFYCLCCGRLTGGTLLCHACEQEMEDLRLPEQPQYPWRAVWRHQGAPRRLVHVLKYEGVAAAAQPLAWGLSEAARKMKLPPDTVVTWVTMPVSRRRERGIDHGRCLAEAVAKELNLPVREMLSRSETIGRKTQQGLDQDQRRLNLEGAFSCNEEITHAVLLVDDVCTTGATAAICYECLLLAGATQVMVLAATRPIMPPENHEGE